MDSLIESLKKFELGENGIDDIICKLNNLATADPNYEWENLIDNYSKLKYLKNMESQLNFSSELIKSLNNFMDSIDKINQYYLFHINFDNETRFIEQFLSESLNFNCPFKKLTIVLNAYEMMIPIIESEIDEKHIEKVEDIYFLKIFKNT